MNSLHVTHSSNGRPVAVLRGFPADLDELTPDDMRGLARALRQAASDCILFHKQQAGKRFVERSYTTTTQPPSPLRDPNSRRVWQGSVTWCDRRYSAPELAAHEGAVVLIQASMRHGVVHVFDLGDEFICCAEMVETHALVAEDGC